MTLVDGLRAVATLSVVLCHSIGFWALPAAESDVMAWLADHAYRLEGGVDVFFVLSGFVIAFSIRNRHVTPGFIGRFALRRSVRLDPPYWVAIALTLALIALRQAVGNDPQPFPPLASIGLHLVYAHRFFGYEHIDAVFWTLCLEVQFYLLFIVALCLLQRVERGRRKFVGDTLACLTVLALAWPVAFPDYERTAVFFLPHFWKFLLGATLMWTWLGRVSRGAMPLVLGLCLVVSMAVGHQGMIVAALAGVLLAVAAHRQQLYRWLNHRWLIGLGLISYSLYLVHLPVHDVMLAIQKRLAPDSPAVAVACFLVYVALSLGVAALMYRWVELPAIRLARRVAYRPSTPPATATPDPVDPASDPDTEADADATDDPTAPAVSGQPNTA